MVTWPIAICICQARNIGRYTWEGCIRTNLQQSSLCEKWHRVDHRQPWLTNVKDGPGIIVFYMKLRHTWIEYQSLSVNRAANHALVRQSWTFLDGLCIGPSKSCYVNEYWFIVNRTPRLINQEIRIEIKSFPPGKCVENVSVCLHQTWMFKPWSVNTTFKGLPLLLGKTQMFIEHLVQILICSSWATYNQVRAAA